MAHDPSSPSKLPVPESRATNFDNLSCILVPDLSGTRNLDRIEHAPLLPSFWYEILVPVTWTENLDRVSWALGKLQKLSRLLYFDSLLAVYTVPWFADMSMM